MHNIFRIKSDNSMMCGLSCFAFIEFTIAGNSLLDCTNSYYPNNYKQNDKIIYKYFKDKYGKKQYKPSCWAKKLDQTRNYLLG